MIRPVTHETLAAIVEGHHHDPHAILGPHVHEGQVTVRILRPLAQRVQVVTGGTDIELAHEYGGIWVGVIPQATVPDYRLRVHYDNVTVDSDDPYRFLPTLGQMDLHLISEGRHERLWEVLGTHLRCYDTELGPVRGTSFAVWAPNAMAVRVCGDFNAWDGSSAPMRSLGSSGVWELFIPGVVEGAHYKFEILGRDGIRRLKADPMARRTEQPPSTASIVTASSYDWGDEAWMTSRPAHNPHTAAMSTYEVHLGSWRPGLTYRDLAEALVAYVRDHGFTHVEFLPVMEHPYGPSWGYQVTSYYAPSSRFGSPDEFRLLIDHLHRAGIGVILDWVPAHFPKDDWALARFDGTALYEHADPQRGEHPDWGTLIFDFGRPEVRNFLVANALYWLEEFHIDGLRVDAVASMLYLDYSREPGEWTANEHGGRENLDAVRFIQELNATAYRRAPGIVTIAEESTAWPGVTASTDANGLGFGLKWNMGWMNDTLEYIGHDPIHRKYHHDQLTFAFVYQWSENYVLPLSHDEVVHGKGSLLRRMPGDRWQQMANLRAYLGYMWAHPGKKLLFMGGEFGQWAEWNHEYGLDWWLLDNADHRGIQRCVADLNRVYRAHPALWSRDHEPGGFQWIRGDAADDNVLAWLRWDHAGRPLASITNFSPVPRENWALGLPSAGRWIEVVNTDATEYEGSGVGNLGAIEARHEARDGFAATAHITLPPLATLWFVPAT